MRGIFLIMAAALMAIGCSPKRERCVTPAFYYWRSCLTLNDQDLALLRQLGTSRLYVRMFDIGWSESTRSPIPIAALRIETSLPEGLLIVPTIYIENDVFDHLRFIDLPGLSNDVLFKVRSILSSGGVREVNELQLDCDWTPRTQETYFALLRLLAEHEDCHDLNLSCTIRLHQLKLGSECGTPPVSRGMLMCYNMAPPGNYFAERAILDPDLLPVYLRNAGRYPLPLDVALPLFSWARVFHNRRFVALVNHVRAQDLNNREVFQFLGNGHWSARETTQIKGQRIRRGDEIFLDGVSARECQQAAIILRDRLPDRNLVVSLFHYDPRILENYGSDELQAVYHALN